MCPSTMAAASSSAAAERRVPGRPEGNQSRATAGRIENARVAVYLTCAAPVGHAAIDRELYLPESWTGDPARCRAAGIPDGTTFATKPRLARRMIARPLDAGRPRNGLPATRPTAPILGCARTWRNARPVYALAVAKSHRVNAGAGACRADWQGGAAVALVLGLAAIGVQVWELLNLPFYPGSAGFASVFVGAMPVFVVVVFGADRR
jgi:hypothetical protein